MSEARGVPAPCEFDLDEVALKIDEIVPCDVGIVAMEVGKIMARIEQATPWSDLDGVQLALQEALANAIIHGNGCNSAKVVRICVAVQEDGGVLVVVKDSGPGFDPSVLPNPLAEQNLFASHGRGIFLMKQLVDDVWYDFKNGTAVYMLKRGRRK